MKVKKKFHLEFMIIPTKYPFIGHLESQKDTKEILYLVSYINRNESALDFNEEVNTVKSKFTIAVKYINSLINSFRTENNDPIIPNWLYKEKIFILEYHTVRRMKNLYFNLQNG